MKTKAILTIMALLAAMLAAGACSHPAGTAGKQIMEEQNV
jgi:hypothetical protein